MILLAHDHLRWKVVQCAAEGITARRWRMYRPAKVSNLQGVPQADENVLRLDVSVDDVLGMAVLDSLDDVR